MRLTFKLMSAILLVMAVLLTIHGYLVVQREVDLFEEDMERRAYLLGSVLASSAKDIWRIGGQTRVFEIINDANRAEDVLRVRWVWFGDDVDSSFTPHAQVADTEGLKAGKEVLIHDQQYQNDDYLFAYFPVLVENAHVAAVELSQPLAPMYDYIVTTIVRQVVLFLAIMIVGGVLLWQLGVAMVGWPVRSMVDQARRVGDGDLDARTSLGRHRDELSELSEGLNQ
ncbi:MAG: HAMP domain-containing protein, partial [bacterium]